MRQKLLNPTSQQIVYIIYKWHKQTTQPNKSQQLSSFDKANDTKLPYVFIFFVAIRHNGFFKVLVKLQTTTPESVKQ